LWFDPDRGRVTVLAADARVALQATAPAPRFDVVFGDAFHDISVPAHLVTDEFAGAVAARLTERGVYVSNIVDAARDPMFVFAFVRTLQAHFDSVEVWLADDVSIEDRRVTYIVLAGESPSPGSVLRSRFGLERTWLRWPPDDLAPRIARFGAPVLTDAFAPVDRLLFAGRGRGDG
jgi:spermidine synthase